MEISFRISTSKLETNTTVISYIISILVAAISAFMLESLLRGLILRVATEHFGFCIANILNVTLTITWHMLIYIFSIIFTNMSTSTFLISILFTCIIYGTSSARKSLYVWATQSIWHCIFDCFISLFVIRNVVLTVNLPIDFIPSNTLEKILVFLTSNSVNSNYLTIAFICAVNILSLIVMIIYYQLLKTRALKKYIKQMKENDL
ncbi:MAG: hypothetical protein IKU25_06290 [Clostridia bacterium]|nr:hypothetical protein [Clostridia bacterium]